MGDLLYGLERLSFKIVPLVCQIRSVSVLRCSILVCFYSFRLALMDAYSGAFFKRVIDLIGDAERGRRFLC
jgi:hypothetical protein